MNNRIFPLIILSFLIIASCGSEADKRKSFRSDIYDSSANNPEQTVIVGPGGDFITLKEALDSAPDNILRFLIKEGTYTESGIIISRDCEIIGEGSGKSIIQGAEDPGESHERILTIEEEAEVLIEGVSIRNGVTREILRRGGGILNLGFLRMDSCHISGNAAVYGAGMDNRGKAVIVRTSFSGNYTLPLNQEEVMTGVGCTGSGGGIKNEPGGILFMEDCTLTGNSSLKRGGGLFVACESSTVLNNCVITENSSRREGGGIYVRGDLTLIGCEIRENSSAETTGGLFNMGFLNFSGNIIRDNSGNNFKTGSGGAGIYGRGIVGIDENNLIENY